MILGLSAVNFVLILICAFAAGALGGIAAVMLCHKAFAKKQASVQDMKPIERGWQRNALDEQLYNGR